MTKRYSASLAALVGFATILAVVPATAQSWRDRDSDGRPHSREWSRDGGGRSDRWDRRDNRRDWNRGWRGDRGWRHYGGRYGYEGYRGHWRTGQRYPYWRNDSYYLRDWRRYGLPPPWRGYRYYRADDGDVVMVAIATGMIGLIISGSLGY